MEWRACSSTTSSLCLGRMTKQSNSGTSVAVDSSCRLGRAGQLLLMLASEAGSRARWRSRNDVDTGVSVDLCSLTESSWTLNKRCVLGLADICLRTEWRWTLHIVHAGTSVDLFYLTESSLTQDKRCIPGLAEFCLRVGWRWTWSDSQSCAWVFCGF